MQDDLGTDYFWRTIVQNTVSDDGNNINNFLLVLHYVAIKVVIVLTYSVSHAPRNIRGTAGLLTVGSII